MLLKAQVKFPIDDINSWELRSRKIGFGIGLRKKRRSRFQKRVRDGF